jgi:hypothetical protein
MKVQQRNYIFCAVRLSNNEQQQRKLVFVLCVPLAISSQQSAVSSLEAAFTRAGPGTLAQRFSYL